MKIVENRYDGISVDPASLPNTLDAFTEEITQLIHSTKDKKLLWVQLPIEKSHYIAVLTKLGFAFHHCNEKNLMLVKMLVKASIIPTAKNYTVGVGAIIMVNDTLLVVKDRFSRGYKLPGGHIDNHERITDALKREVFEETGIEAAFESIVNIGHFTQGQFDESNLYVVCTAKALSSEITIHDESEIIEARWIDVDEFLNLEDTNNYNKKVVQASIHNQELKLTEQPISLNVPWGEVFF